LQTSALKDPTLITRLAERFGSQSILVSADIKKNWRGQYRLYSAATCKLLDQPWLEFLHKAVKLGAGEIVINSVEKDGTMSGMDIELIARASQALSVPLIAVGGVGSLGDIKAAVDAGASAVAAGAYFVFQGKHRAVLITYPRYQELETVLR
jgi:cyclase